MHNESVDVKEVPLTYAKAINAALRRVLSECNDTILYGEDVAKPGGVFGVTKDLQRDFGTVRVFDTPISETAMLGAAVGAAMTGLRPIVEIMWIDFSLVAMDQIVNQAANVRYVSAGRLSAPLTIRTQQGALPGSCAQHAQNLEALFAHIPGLRVGIPSTPQDAYGMLLAAVHGDDPTLIIENRGLYHGEAEPVRIDGPVEPARGGRVLRPGKDITILTWGAIGKRAMDAAAALQEQDGISAEVLDARWIAPFDWDLLNESVARTTRLLIVHEANVTGGFGAEVAAHVQQSRFGMLAAPVRRLGVPDVRMPAAPHLQDALIPDAGKIRAVALEMVRPC